ncbi:hypothetical protein BpHYR1_012533 [Brachionus plicatilis]|uniref:Uncharacterized protein n=1 Tax=Brachionus plicatilis TaxID=10195 RepID=A0A3M7SCE2_BRAPC|nr:hypothetical protein BpHYR1_012533 [Brachionus plicatilis]
MALTKIIIFEEQVFNWVCGILKHIYLQVQVNYVARMKVFDTLEYLCYEFGRVALTQVVLFGYELEQLAALNP